MGLFQHAPEPVRTGMFAFHGTMVLSRVCGHLFGRLHSVFVLERTLSQIHMGDAKAAQEDIVPVGRQKIRYENKKGERRRRAFARLYLY